MNSSRTESQIFFLCDVYVTPIICHIPSKYNIYQHVQNPAEENRGFNVFGHFHFKLCPPGVPGTDVDGLADTQEADVANGHTPGLSVNTVNNFAFNIIEKMFPPKRSHCPWDSCREHDQGVGYKQTLNNQICESWAVSSEVTEEIMVKKREISQDSKYILG